VTFPPIPGVNRVVGLCGHARAGKDSVAVMLLKLWPGAERFAFSDALAAHCRVVHGMRSRDARVLQDIGMAMRETHPGIWLRALYGTIEDRRPEVAIITGVRFADEAAMVREMGGQIVRVVRREPDGRRFVSLDRDPTHRAEAGVDGLEVDAEIAAPSGDLPALHRAVCQWVADQTAAVLAAAGSRA